MTFEIHRASGVDGRASLRASARLTSQDFDRIARELGEAPRRARKVGFVAARRAEGDEAVETRWNGKETSNVAHPGDYVVTNLSPEGDVLRDRDGSVNTYVIRADRFPSLYETTGKSNAYGEVYRACGSVDAILLAGGFDILAPWGERQQAAAGYLIRNGEDVYGNNKDTFEATYRLE